MKTKLLLALLAASLCAFHLQAAAAEETAATPDTKAESKSDAKTELRELVGKIQTKLSAGKQTEAELADDLKEFDALLAKHKDEKTDDVAQILFMKAMLYAQVFNNTEKARELMAQLKTDFPETGPGKQATQMLVSLERMAEGEKVRASIKVGAPFPDFEEKDLAGKPLSIAGYKGKVVLVDFWATWCGPCVAELPNVLKAYEKHHDKGFEIIGISLDKERDELAGFVKEHNMTWPQYFDGKGWENKLSQKYGVNSIPATYLLDTEGKIAAKDLRGDALEAEVARLLEKK